MPTSNYAQISGKVASMGLDPAVDCRIVRNASGHFVIEPGSWMSETIPQPTEAEIDAFSPVISDSERARQYAEAYAAAEQIIFLLMGRVAPALVMGGFFTPQTVNAEGTRFMAFHRDLIIDFKNSGRHPDAGTLLYNAIASAPSRTEFPWLSANGEAILQIFATGLPRNA